MCCVVLIGIHSIINFIAVYSGEYDFNLFFIYSRVFHIPFIPAHLPVLPAHPAMYVSAIASLMVYEKNIHSSNTHL